MHACNRSWFAVAVVLLVYSSQKLVFGSIGNNACTQTHFSRIKSCLIPTTTNTQGAGNEVSCIGFSIVLSQIMYAHNRAHATRVNVRTRNAHSKIPKKSVPANCPGAIALPRCFSRTRTTETPSTDIPTPDVTVDAATDADVTTDDPSPNTDSLFLQVQSGCSPLVAS